MKQLEELISRHKLGTVGVEEFCRVLDTNFFIIPEEFVDKYVDELGVCLTRIGFEVNKNEDLSEDTVLFFDVMNNCRMNDFSVLFQIVITDDEQRLLWGLKDVFALNSTIDKFIKSFENSSYKVSTDALLRFEVLLHGALGSCNRVAYEEKQETYVEFSFRSSYNISGSVIMITKEVRDSVTDEELSSSSHSFTLVHE